MPQQGHNFNNRNLGHNGCAMDSDLGHVGSTMAYASSSFDGCLDKMLNASLMRIGRLHKRRHYTGTQMQLANFVVGQWSHHEIQVGHVCDFSGMHAQSFFMYACAPGTQMQLVNFVVRQRSHHEIQVGHVHVIEN